MCRSQPMNLRSCVLLNGWRCCTTITIGYAKQSARSPVAQTFMIWSFDWGSAWSRSPFASTELSTLVFRDHVLWRSRKSILFRPKGTGRAAPRRGNSDYRHEEMVHLRQRWAFDHLCRPTVSALSRQEQRRGHATRSVRARESPIGNLLPKSETNGAFFLDANDNRVCRMNLSLFRGPGKDDLNPASIPISKRNSFPPRETWGRMTFQ